MSADKVLIGNAARNIEESPPYAPITNVKIIVGEDEDGKQIAYTAKKGTSSGRILEIENPWGTQAMADNIFEAVKGYAYKPFEATGAILDPVAEIGDGVTVGDVYSVIANTETTFSPIMSATVGAAGGYDLDHEYPYEDSTERSITQSLAKMRTEFIVEQGRIEARVENSEENIGGLYDRISDLEITADGIVATVAASQDKYVIPDGVSIDQYGYGKPELDASMYSGQQYLDQSSGQIWESDGTSWHKVGTPLEKVTASLQSEIEVTAQGVLSTVSETYSTKTEAQGYATDAVTDGLAEGGSITRAYTTAIEQTARQIRGEVSASIDKYDYSGLPPNSGIIQGYGEPTNASYKPSSNKNKVYVNLTTGEWWRSIRVDGTYTWVKQDGSLQTVNDVYDSRITVNAEAITSEVSARKTAIEDVESKITQTASSIKAEVFGGYADEWSPAGKDGTNVYSSGDYVRVTQYIDPGNPSSGVASMTFYKCIANHLSFYTSTQPGVGSEWQLYWVKDSSPSVQSAINVDLSGIEISYGSSAYPNSAYIKLTKDNVEIGAGTITMSNVQADTIAANTSMTTPVIFGTNLDLKEEYFSGFGTGIGKRWSIYNGHSYYPFMSFTRWGNSIYFQFDSGTAILYEYDSVNHERTFTCYGTWDFSHATLIT